LLLLVPSVIISILFWIFLPILEQPLHFNISGPVCLAVVSIYTYRR
jgi:hypothetical protein